MADTPHTFSAISAALAVLIENNIQPMIHRAATTLQMLPKIPNYGQAVTWDVVTGAEVDEDAPIAEGTDVPHFNKDTPVKASLTYTTYHQGFAINGLAQAIARVAGGPEGLANLRVFEMDNAATRLGATIGKHLFTGTNTNSQLAGFLDSTAGAMLATGTYAGLDKGTYTQFAGNVIDCSAANVAFGPALFRKMLSTIVSRADDGARPDLITASTLVFDKIAGWTDAQRRYDMDVVTFAGGRKVTLDPGTEVLFFNGIPIMRDTRIPETTVGSVLFLNTRNASLRYVPFPTAEDIMTGQVMVGEEGQLMSRNTGLMYKLEKLAKTGDKDKYAIFCYIQAQMRSPNKHGWIKNIPVG